MQFLNGYYVALQSKLPFHVALLQVLQTGKQSAMLLIILFCLSRYRSLMCYGLYKCTVRIGCTRSSSLFKEVKQHWARLVRGWMTIPGIFFALIPQYLWPVGISVSSPCVCPSKLWNGVDKFYKETRSQKVNDQFQQISVPNTRVVQILRRFIE